MFIRFFYTLRKFGVPVSTQELLDLNAAVAHHLAFADMTQFYQLSRLIMVKDERYFDKFDRAFQAYMQQLSDVEIDNLLDQLDKIPKDWLDLELLEKNLTAEQRAELSQAGSLAELLQQLEQRLQEQHKKHQGGNKMIGTGGTSPFGAYGDHPQGIRVGGPSRKRSAVKVWGQRQYQNLDADHVLGTRQMQMALRRLRKFARQGMPQELDIQQTIQKTAQKGVLDIQMVAERRNGIKVLMLFDVGGSMDAHIQQCEQLFSAAKQQFKSLDYFYFHNCIYEMLWKDNQRRQDSKMSTWDILHKYGQDYRVIIVGDASMATYELNVAGGSVEYMSDEAGRVWLQRIQQHFSKTAWLNPELQEHWQYTQTIGQIQQIFEQHMYPLTLSGLDDMIRHLAK
ncbi:vWA domain-containing protein [Acinetobacter sp. MD2]|uniref:vWA domain-containing protein n=1 Tax=Acinetobacter sp. MD2 TaxID=2600066 RepID=UPI002D1F48B7|nr:VWA domain-containing protein [Acinetobacter sp. MD2]MEB3766327.1 VWA domain-containing protein [Acinetobacter sp. MD2]